MSNLYRQAIINQANRHLAFRQLTSRHIQQAVCIVRHHQSVDPHTLHMAGFNPERRGKIKKRKFS